MPTYNHYGAPQKYGTSINYGSPPSIWDYHVLLREPSTNGIVVAVLKDDITALNFMYDRYGGCQSAQITLQRELNSYGLIGARYIVEIYTSEVDQSKRTLRWTGYVEPLTAKLAERAVTINARGLSDWLNRLVLPQQSYSNYSDVSGVVASIIDTYVVPGSKIKHTAAMGLIQNCGVSVTEVEFNSTVMQALRHLSMIGGNAEWGVRADREFYFMPRSEANRLYAAESTQPPSDRNLRTLVDLEIQISKEKDVNWLYVQAGDGVQYLVQTAPYNSGAQMEAIEIAPAVMSQADALLWGASYLARSNGLTLSIEEKFSGLVANDLNLLTPAMHYIQSTITIIYPSGYVKDSDNTTPSVAGHYSHQSDGRVYVKTGASDIYLIARYDIRTGGHSARVVMANLSGVLESLGLPLASLQINTDKWRGYKLPIQRVNYVLTNARLRAEVECGEDIPGLGQLHETINFKLSELNQAI